MADQQIAIIELSEAVSQAGDKSISWALGRLEAALSALPRRAETVRLRVGSFEDFDDAPSTIAQQARRDSEAFGIWSSDGVTTLAGGGRRGLVYAITEMADRLRLAPETALQPSEPTCERSALPVRAVARVVSSAATDRAWFLDEQFWTDYLDMLADCRFNGFSLHLGMPYNHPSHNNMLGDTYMLCPYPFFVKVPGYDVGVTELSDVERAHNLTMLGFIVRETKRRGLDFRLGLWTQYYDFDTVPDPNYHVTGITAANRNGYCAAAIELLLKACPGIDGMTFRIHSESGVADGDFDFWRGIFGGIRRAGGPLDVDMHSKGIDQSVLDLAREAGLAITVSPKYLGEHMGLPYHTASLRVRDRTSRRAAPPGRHLTHGLRAFTRHSYADFLPAKRDWNVVFRIWPGTQRVLLWADPAMAAGYGRHAGICGARGIEWCEPLTYYGRMGPAIPGGRQGYIDTDLATTVDWHKYAYQYRVWGRLLFCPDADPDGWRRYLRKHCGDAAAPAEAALATASRVLPLVTQTHGVSVSNHGYWPEIYSNYPVLDGYPNLPGGTDVTPPVRFGNVSTFDPQLFSNPREYVGELLSGEETARYNPLQVAEWLEDLADRTDAALLRLKASRGSSRPESRRIAADAGIEGAVGRFFAHKYRSACWAELFLATAHRPALGESIEALRRALAAWETAASIGARCYMPDMPYGVHPYMRGSWLRRLDGIRDELHNLVGLHALELPKPEPAPAGGLERVLAVLAAPVRVAAITGVVDPPKSFRRGEVLPIALAGEADARDVVLHYRHVNQGAAWQQMAFDVDSRVATVSAEYTDSDFHLQFYVAGLSGDGAVILGPGLSADLSNQPYYLCLQA